VTPPRDRLAAGRRRDLGREVRRAVDRRFSRALFFALTVPGIEEQGQREIARVMGEEQGRLVAELLSLLDDDQGGGGA
jgi:hypothetical protein